MFIPGFASSVRLSDVADDAITIGGVDLSDPDTYASGMPHDAFRELRRRAPVAWHPHADGPGFLALTGYDEVLAVSRDSATWSSQSAGVFFEVPRPGDEFQLELMMLTMDPPRHTKLRSLVSKGFTPRQVAKLNNHVADMAREIVDDVVQRGECDFVDDVAGALPSYVIAELLGIPLEDGRRLYELTEIMNSGAVGDTHHDVSPVLDAQMQMFQYGTELAARKRAVPGDDIATSLLEAEVDGERLTDLEFNMFFLLLINAGGDTTRNLVAAGILAMMEHPDRTSTPCRRPVAAADRDRGDAALHEPGDGIRADGDEGHRVARNAREGRRPGGDVLPVGQPRRDRASTIPTASTSGVRPTRTWRSAAAERISASARTSPAWRRPRSFPRCCRG